MIFRVAAALSVLLASACAVVPEGDGSSERSAIVTTLEQITADPEAWAGKWVTLEGVLVWGESQSRIYKDAAAAEDGWVYDPAGISIRMSESRRPVPKALNAKWIRVTAILDDSCILAHRWAQEMASSNTIAWASGYCHTAIGPDLVDATVRRTGAPS